MKYLLLAMFSIGVASGHLLEGVPSSLTISYRSGHSITLGSEKNNLSTIVLTLNGTTITLPQEELSDLPYPNLRSVRLFETDLDKVKKYHLELQFGIAPDLHGSLGYESEGDTVRFYFSEGRYAVRVVTLEHSREDRLGLEPAKHYSKKPGKPEEPPNRNEDKKKANKAEMATPRKPSD